MHNRLFRTIVLVAMAAALGGVLVAVAGADDSAPLPGMSAPELLARMGDHSRAPAAISGDISWTNDLFGQAAIATGDVGMAAQSPLIASGSGRLWAQEGKVRFESQGQGGDQVLVANAEAGTVWTYDFAGDTAHLYRLEGDGGSSSATGADGDGTGSQAQDSPSPEAPTPERVAGFLQSAARFMNVDVTGQTVVAGREAYVLTMTLAATDTALGKVETAIDGRTFVPLRLDVVAKGYATSTLSFRFDRVSYEPVSDAVFVFTPPEGAKVQRDTIDLKGESQKADKAGAQEASGASRADAMEQVKKLARTALLTRAEAARLVDFPLAWARDYAARDFRWAYVFDKGAPVDALGAPVFDMAKVFGGLGGGGAASDAAGASGASSGDAAGGSSPTTGPMAVQLYGEGFGSIALAQTKTTAEIRDQLKQLPEVADSIDLGGVQAKAVVTPLGSVVVWERDGVTSIAAGMVPRADIVAFVASVR